MRKTRILYLALADARGHLMRAHLLRELLAPRGFELDIVTTGADGQRFLEALGTPSRVLSTHLRMEFGDRHDMRRRETDRRVLSYFVRPDRCRRDLAQLEEWAKDTAFVVCDSLHPALLVAPLVGSAMRVVHVFGENLWDAAEQNFDARAPRWFSEVYASALREMRDRAFARITHTLGLQVQSHDPFARSYLLPPLLALPRRSPKEVKRELEIQSGERLAVVYLNPHFRDERIAAAVERALGDAGFRVHAVGEGFADRAGWRAEDPHLVERIQSADLFVSGAGMATLGQARAFGVPLVVLLGDQPEQIRNVAALAATAEGAVASVRLEGDFRDLARRVGDAMQGVRAPSRSVDPLAGLLRVQSLWTSVFTEIALAAGHAAVTTREKSHANDRAHSRDEQPSRRSARLRRFGDLARPPLGAPPEAEPAARLFGRSHHHA